MGTAFEPTRRLLFKTISSVLQSPLLYQNLAKEVHFMTDCIFCKIIAGDIPAAKVYEDEAVLAFLDISQVTPGPPLVVQSNTFVTFWRWTEAALANSSNVCLKSPVKL